MGRWTAPSDYDYSESIGDPVPRQQRSAKPKSYYESCAIPKGEPKAKSKRREKRLHADHVSEVRQYVFARERNICRCCRARTAESMHEVVPRGAGGKVSRRNSIAVCGQIVGTDRSCHTFLQLNQINVTAQDAAGAEGTLTFTALTELAATCMKLKVGGSIESAPMVAVESEV